MLDGLFILLGLFDINSLCLATVVPVIINKEANLSEAAILSVLWLGISERRCNSLNYRQLIRSENTCQLMLPIVTVDNNNGERVAFRFICPRELLTTLEAVN
jgi:hypothetical protein